jgi:hypothetical protein
MKFVFPDRCLFAKPLRSFILTNCQDIDLGQIQDFEDPAIGAGILNHNLQMFDDHAQVCTVLNTLY